MMFWLTLLPLVFAGSGPSSSVEAFTVNAGAGAARIRRLGRRWRWEASVGARRSAGDEDTSDLAVLSALEFLAVDASSPVLAMGPTSSWAALPDGSWWRLDSSLAKAGLRSGQADSRAEAVRAALGGPV